MNAELADWKENDRVWFIAEPNAEPVVVKITRAMPMGWCFRSFDGSITGIEPLFTERLVDIVGLDAPTSQTQKMPCYSECV